MGYEKGLFLKMIKNFLNSLHKWGVVE